jgi:hypothetical protein
MEGHDVPRVELIEEVIFEGKALVAALGQLVFCAHVDFLAHVGLLSLLGPARGGS